METEASASTCMSEFQTKNNKMHSLTIQVFTARLPGVGTILSSGSTMMTTTEKGPSCMELAFQRGRAEGKQMMNQMIADYANEPGVRQIG